jgi:hypothetical protein
LAVVGVAALAGNKDAQKALVDLGKWFGGLFAKEAEAPGEDAIPEEDKDEIAKHAADTPGRKLELDADSPEEIKEKINEVLSDPGTLVGDGVDAETGEPKTGYMAPNGTLVIHNPAAPGKGTIMTPTRGLDYFTERFKIRK